MTTPLQGMENKTEGEEDTELERQEKRKQAWNKDRPEDHDLDIHKDIIQKPRQAKDRFKPS